MYFSIKRAGGGAPNKDYSGNLLLKKGVFVNDYQTLYKEDGGLKNKGNFIEENYRKDDNFQRNINDSLQMDQQNHENFFENTKNFKASPASMQYNTNPNQYNQQNPQYNSQKINEMQRNPEYIQRNPEYLQRNPGYSQKINEIQRNPEYFQRNPEYLQRNPEYIQRNPENSQRYPENIQRNPENLQRNPEYIQRNPENLQRNPEYIQRNPENVQRYPEFPQRNPEYIQRNPEYIQRNPEYIQKNPEYLQRNPDIPPPVPKVLDMKQIEKEFLQQTEYNRIYNPNSMNNLDLNALKNANFFSFQEYEKNSQMKKYQEHILLQKGLFDQIEDKRKKKEEQKQAELLKQQQEEERLKRQRDEIIEKYNRDMEKKQLELKNLQDFQNLQERNNKNLENSKNNIEISKNTIDQKNAEFLSKKDEKAQNSRIYEEIQIKEEEKLREIQAQKALYEEKLEDVNSHLITLKNQLFSQQNTLNEELNKLKAEALLSNEQRFRSQRDLENLREDLKRQELFEEIRRNELNQALLKNRPYRDYSDQSTVIYPKFARDFNKALRFHQINNEYINDSIDNLVQRTNFIPLMDYNQPIKEENIVKFTKNLDEFEYSNGVTKSAKIQTLPVSLLKGYERNEGFDALNVMKMNEERLEELKKLDRSEGVDMQGHLDNLMNEINRK